MRLTLRTLLAWLDDTLSPSEVREIGKQVAESPFAKELVEKIHKVTRQRRLTIPPTKGADVAKALGKLAMSMVKSWAISTNPV